MQILILLRVADVDVNPRNPVINTRSFGGDPRNVAQKVVAYARGLEDGGYCLSVNIFRDMEIRKWILIRRYRF